MSLGLLKLYSERKLRIWIFR